MTRLGWMPGRNKSHASFEKAFWRTLEAALVYSRKAARLQFATRPNRRAARNDKVLNNNEDNGGIAVLMIRVFVGEASCVGIMLVVKATPVMISAAKLNITSQRIREMNMVVRMFDAVHH